MPGKLSRKLKKMGISVRMMRLVKVWLTVRNSFCVLGEHQAGGNLAVSFLTHWSWICFSEIQDCFWHRKLWGPWWTLLYCTVRTRAGSGQFPWRAVCAEQVGICRMGQGNAELQSDAQRKFCAMLWAICPLEGICPGETWALDLTMENKCKVAVKMQSRPYRYKR